jgi:alkylated DNA repair protein alkB family protein 6
MYKVYLHGIKEVQEDKIIPESILNYERLNKKILNSDESIKRDTRVSLTIRHVPKVLKINVNSLLFKNKK